MVNLKVGTMNGVEYTMNKLDVNERDAKKILEVFGEYENSSNDLEDFIEKHILFYTFDELIHLDIDAFRGSGADLDEYLEWCEDMAQEKILKCTSKGKKDYISCVLWG
jgi:hypothetical protein